MGRAKESSLILARFANALRLVLGLDPLFQDGRRARNASSDAERFACPSYAWPDEVQR